MITLDRLERWLSAPVETENLEFKEAKQQFHTTKTIRYCAALANEGGLNTHPAGCLCSRSRAGRTGNPWLWMAHT